MELEDIFTQARALKDLSRVRSKQSEFALFGFLRIAEMAEPELSEHILDMHENATKTAEAIFAAPVDAMLGEVSRHNGDMVCITERKLTLGSGTKLVLERSVEIDEYGHDDAGSKADYSLDIDTAEMENIPEIYQSEDALCFDVACLAFIEAEPPGVDEKEDIIDLQYSLRSIKAVARNCNVSIPD